MAEKRICGSCLGAGTWETECCDGSGGCSCRGQRVAMGPCNACRGTGYQDEHYDSMANVRSIAGFGYVGSGPRYTGGGIYDRIPRMGR